MPLLNWVCRFPDQYVLYAPNTMEAHHFEQYTCALHNFFNTPDQEDEMWFWNGFATPIVDARRHQQFRRDVDVRGEVSPLERLPTELVDHVLDSFVDAYDIPWKTKQDMLALGLSSRILYPVVLSRIHREQNHRRTSPWAGKRIGFYAAGAKMPLAHTDGQYTYWDFLYPSKAMSSWSWKKSVLQPGMEWRRAISEVRVKWNGFLETDWQNIQIDISQAYRFPQDRIWVLRNLTTRQIVRSDALVPPDSVVPAEAIVSPELSYKNRFRDLWHKLTAGSKSDNDMPELEPLSLAQILLVLTVYADSDDVPRLERKFYFQKGIWSTHAFDVVTLDNHIESLAMSKTQWTDVSASVVADVGNLRWCVQRAETARTWPEHEAQFWDGVIMRARREWRFGPSAENNDAT